MSLPAPCARLQRRLAQHSRVWAEDGRHSPVVVAADKLNPLLVYHSWDFRRRRRFRQPLEGHSLN